MFSQNCMNNHNLNNSMNSSEVGDNINEEESKNIYTLTNENNEYLKNKLRTKITQQKKQVFNLEIPIEFRNDLLPSQNLSSLLSKLSATNPPILFLDLTDPCYELELQLSELSSQLQEKTDTIKKLEKKLQESEKQIKDFTNKLKEKDKDLKYYKSLDIEIENKIKELNQKKETLIKSLPNKLDEESKKNISIKEYQEIKFTPAKIEESYITKTLQKDLLDYRLFIKGQIERKMDVIDILFKTLQQCATETSKDFELKLFGSYATGLCLPWSDVDIILIYKGVNPVDQYIGMLWNSIHIKKHLFKSIKLEDNKLKIVATEEYKNIKLNLVLQEESSPLLKYIDLIKSYLKEYVVLEPLVLALQTILKNANLNNPNSGGLSSYGLILMIVSFIQSKIDSNSYQDEEDLVGKTFYQFLGHYGIYFDYQKYVILTYPINDMNKDSAEQDSDLNFGQNFHELIIVDPLNKQNNVAKLTYQFMNLKMAFMIAFMVTKEDCECGCHYGKAVNEHSMKSTEHCILKRMFNSVKRFSDSK